jgi:hypothetical protein
VFVGTRLAVRGDDGTIEVVHLRVALFAGVAAALVAAFTVISLPATFAAVALCMVPVAGLVCDRREGSVAALVAAGVAAGAADGSYLTLALALAAVALVAAGRRIPALVIAASALAPAAYAADLLLAMVAVLVATVAVLAWSAVSGHQTRFRWAAALAVAVAVVVPSVAAVNDRLILAPVVVMVAAAVAGVSFASLRSGSRGLVAAVAASVLLAAPVGLTAPTETAPAGSFASAVKVQSLTRCETLSTLEAVECYASELIDVYDAAGLAEAISVVYAAYESPAPLGPHFANNCHEALHFLAKAVAMDEPDPTSVIRSGTNLCAAGFGHGVWEVSYGSMTTDELTELAPTICRGWEGFNRSEEGSAGIGCRHILGHTLGTRFIGQVGDVAEVCLVRDPTMDPDSDWLQDEIIARDNCLAGLFMENFLSITRTRPDDPINADPFLACSDPKVAGNALIAWGCYNEIGGVLAPKLGFDIGLALQACREQGELLSLEGHVLAACFDSVARASAPALEYELDAAVAACDPISDEELRDWCARSLAATLFFNSNNRASGEAMCALIRDPEMAEDCGARLDDVEGSLGASKVTNGVQVSPGAP